MGRLRVVARIELKDIAHRYDADAPYALAPLSVTWEHGRRYAVLGPSGCGKTTMLNIMSGIIAPSEGEVLFDGAPVTGLRTAERNIAQVFQFPVIYATMTVRENLAFPLLCRNAESAVVKRKVGEVAELLGLESVLERVANRLTADQKQLISLGRGLVRDDVAAILMDEPLTVIDPDLKWKLRRKLKQINEQYSLTLIYVTHDQNEAMTFADEIAVMNEGRIVQTGGAPELFENPGTEFIGYFIGTPPMNMYPCAVVGAASVMVGSQRLDLSFPIPAGGGEYKIGIRPEYVRLRSCPGANRVRGRVLRVEDFGNYKLVSGTIEGVATKFKIRRDSGIALGEVDLFLLSGKLKLFCDGVLVAGQR